MEMNDRPKPTDTQKLLTEDKGAGPIDFSKRLSQDDDAYLGQKMPPRLANGPVRDRRMTDIFCCICFALFFVAWLTLGIFYSFKGDKLDNLNDILDSEGNYCGIDSNVRDYPYLFMVRFQANYRSVCVKECPKFDYNQIKYNSTGLNTSTIEPLYYEQLNDVVKTSYKLNLDSSINSDSFKYDPDFAGGYYTEEQWNAYVNRFNMECVPNDDVKSCKNNPADSVYIYDSRPGNIYWVCNAVQPRLIGPSSRLANINNSWIQRIADAKWMIFASVFAAFFVTLFFLFISKLMMGVIIWVQLAIALIFCILISILFFFIAFDDNTEALKNNGASAQAIQAYKAAKEYKWWFFSFGLVLAIFSLLLLLYMALKYKKINSNVEVLRFGNYRFMKNAWVMLIAFFMFLLQVTLFLVGIFFIVCCYSSGTVYKDTARGYPYKVYSIPWYTWIAIVFLIVAWLWLFLFINNLADYMNAAIVCEDYFKAKEGFRGFWGAVCNTLIYHIGSVAWAAVILLPCSIIQFLYGPIYDLITKTGDEGGKPNKLQVCLSYACICIKYPYKRWIMRVGEQGFPMSYISSCNFVPAAKEAYYLLISYGETLGDIPLINGLYRLTAVLAISFLNTFIAYLFLYYLPYFKDRLQGNVIAPMLIIFLLSLLVAGIFMNALGTVTEAALICYLIDVDVGHYPRDALLNQFMIDQASKQAKDERMAEFMAAGGKHMGSKYEYYEPEY